MTQQKHMTLEEIASKLGISKTRVQQLEESAVRKLRRRLRHIPEIKEWLAEHANKT